MSIALKFEPGSVDATKGYILKTQEKILAGLRGGMDLAMDGLANVAAGNAPHRTGDLSANIRKSGKVTETKKVIRGTVSAKEPGKLSLGNWLELGIKEPAVNGDLMVFTPPGGDMVFTSKHKAFQIAAHPFMGPSLHEYESQIFDILDASVKESASR